MRTRFALGLALVLSLAACGAGDDPTIADPSPADGSPADEATRTERPTGTYAGALGGDAQLEGGCAWLDTEAEGRMEPRWPDGYRVTFDPVQLVGPDGEVVAEDGETVTVEGAIAGDVFTICQVGPVLEVTAVVDAGGS